MFSSLYIIFISVQAAVSAEAIRVSSFELVYVHAEYALKVKSDSVCTYRKIPSDITEFLCDMLKIKVMSLEAVLLYKVCNFSAFAAQAECRV